VNTTVEVDFDGLARVPSTEDRFELAACTVNVKWACPDSVDTG